eukprot:symbB.v1.2.029843.t1/scaffold3308.1/size59325/3
MPWTLWVAALALPPAGAQPLPRIDDEEYVRPVELVRRILATGPPLKCELPSVDASKMGAEDLEDLAQQYPGGVKLLNLRWLKPEDWSKKQLLRRFGRHWISTGSGRWDRPAATPEVHLEDFAEAAASTDKSWVAKGYTHELVSSAFWGVE